MVVSRLVDSAERTTGYRVSLQGKPDPDRFAKTFGLDLNDRHNDQFLGPVMLLGDYQRLADLITQLE